jgi:hypothetical protein
MAEKTTNETVAEAQTPAPAQNQEPGLTVQDLQSLKAIIDVASSRGAFKPNEMVAVGQTYTKLEQFLATVTPANKE